MNHKMSACGCVLVAMSASACGSTADLSGGTDAGVSPDAPIVFDAAPSADASPGTDSGASGCVYTANTTATSKVSDFGCALLTRDTSTCNASRVAQGLSGDWLKFSCRVKLTKVAATPSYVLLEADSVPDSKSNYWDAANPCYDNYKVPGNATPNKIALQTVSFKVTLAPDAAGSKAPGGNLGAAVNGVYLFGDMAAPPDDIYKAINSFDRCTGHPDPQNGGTYHYHTEPTSITNDDSNLVGIMVDGYFAYGRRDTDNTIPTNLDLTAGHTGVTSHSATPVYHYHVLQETSTTAGTVGQQAWFIHHGGLHGSHL